MLVLTVLVGFVVAILYIWKIWNDLKSKYVGFQNTPNLPIFGSCWHFKPNPSEFLKQIHGFSEMYDRLYVLWFSFRPLLIVARVEFVEFVLKSQEIITKPFEYDFLHEWLYTGLLTSTGSKWKKRRREITPSFHFSILNNFIRIFEQSSKTFVNKIKTKHLGRSIDIQPLVSLATMDVICESAMGVKVNAQNNSNSEYVSTVRSMLPLITKRIRSPWLWPRFLYNFMPSGQQYNSNLQVLHKFTAYVINKQIETRSQSDDCSGRRKMFLDTLLDLYDQGEIDIDGIREEVETFMFEGHDTTSAGISWALYLLGKHPNIQKKLQKEIDALEIENIGEGDLLEKIRNIQYLDFVIKETLRIHPPVSLFGRVISQDICIDGRHIPKGCSIFVDVISLHTHPKYWEKPLEFYPERFGKECFLKRNPFCYVPFSAGPRNCIGQKFALLEMKIFIFYIMLNFDLKAAQEESEIASVLDMIHRSENGLFVQFEKRVK